MSRPLTPDEQALWEKVKRTVRPLGAPARPTGPTLRLKPPAAPTITFAPPAPGPHRETLDGRWDRRITSGKLTPDATIDLHGLTRARARALLFERIIRAHAAGERVLLVITGKGSRTPHAPADLVPGLSGATARRGAAAPQQDGMRGSIRAELPRWLAEGRVTACIAAVRHAHPRHGGQGAVYIILRRQRRSAVR